MTARAVRHRCFGPHVIEIAPFLADTDEVPVDEVVRFFEVPSVEGGGQRMTKRQSKCITTQSGRLSRVRSDQDNRPSTEERGGSYAATDL